MTPPANRVTDEIVEKAVHVYIDTELPSEMPVWQETREALRAALEAVWPEPTFTQEEAEALGLGIRHLLGDPIEVSLIEINPLWRSALAKLEAQDVIFGP